MLKRRLYNILEDYEPSLMEMKKSALELLIKYIIELFLLIWGAFVFSNFNLEILIKGYRYFLFPWAVLFSSFSLLIYIENKIGF